MHVIGMQDGRLKAAGYGQCDIVLQVRGTGPNHPQNGADYGGGSLSGWCTVEQFPTTDLGHHPKTPD